MSVKTIPLLPVSLTILYASYDRVRFIPKRNRIFHIVKPLNYTSVQRHNVFKLFLKDSLEQQKRILVFDTPS